MKKTILVFSALIIALLVLFQISKYSIISGGIKTELVITGIAAVAFFIGIVIIFIIWNPGAHNIFCPEGFGPINSFFWILGVMAQ